VVKYYIRKDVSCVLFKCFFFNRFPFPAGTSVPEVSSSPTIFILCVHFLKPSRKEMKESHFRVELFLFLVRELQNKATEIVAVLLSLLCGLLWLGDVTLRCSVACCCLSFSLVGHASPLWGLPPFLMLPAKRGL
jgi:hypothetical protein